MADTTNLSNFLTDVAISIREKRGTTNEIPASDFDTEILSIETGVMTQEEYDKAIIHISSLLGYSQVIDLFNEGVVSSPFEIEFKTIAGTNPSVADITESINLVTAGSRSNGSEQAIFIKPIQNLNLIQSVIINGSASGSAGAWLKLVVYENPAEDTYTTIEDLLDENLVSHFDAEGNITVDVSSLNLGNKYLAFRARANHNSGTFECHINKITLIYK